MTDPISDMLTQIRNAQAVRKTDVALPYSKLKFNLAKTMEKQGLLGSVDSEGDLPSRMLKLKLKYDGQGTPVISALVRVSKPGQRIYTKAKSMPRTVLGNGISIVSTSQGLMTSEEARKAKLGGELICQIW